MTVFPKQRVSLRRTDGGRAVLEAECGFGLAIVPVTGERHRMAAYVYQEIRDRNGRLNELRVVGGGDSVASVPGFSLYHAGTGMKILPDTWFFADLRQARAALERIGARWGELFMTRDINQLQPLSGPVLALCRACGVVAGRWHDLSAVRLDEDDWAAGAEARKAGMASLPDARVDARKMERRA